MNKIYLGDAVYVALDDHTGDLVLTTEDGVQVTNRIVLEAVVWQQLQDYVTRLTEARLTEEGDR